MKGHSYRGFLLSHPHAISILSLININNFVNYLETNRSFAVYIIGHNYHGHCLHARGYSVNNYVRENKAREVNVRE